jgi:benzodiazapine receptor
MLARYLSLAVFLLLVVTASFIGSGFEAGEWYHFILKQPSWAPPYWLIGPLWALVYVMMALAAWVVWLTGHYSRIGALLWWGLILVLNSGWSALFFGLHRPGWALPVLGLAIGIAVFCIRVFGRLSRQAALLMLPYLLWVIFLALYNLSLWTLNGGFLERFLG